MKASDDGSIILTREELYEKVWTTALRNLAPTLGVSGVGLAKICKRFSVPTPPVGYWAKKEFGKAPQRPRLPASDDPGMEGIRFYPPKPDAGAGEGGELQVLSDQERAKESLITVPPVLASPVKLVEDTQRSLLAAKPDEEGLVRPRAKNTLNVQVAPSSIDRAMRTMNALLLAFEARELPVELEIRQGWTATTIKVAGETLAIALRETTKRVPREPTAEEKYNTEHYPSLYPKTTFYRRVPEGRLSLEIDTSSCNGVRRRWTDSGRRPVERLLNTFIVSLYRVADGIKEERKREEERRRQQEENERRRQEWQKQRQQKLVEIRQEEQKVESLMAEAESWSKSQGIRAYLCDVRTRLLPKAVDDAHRARIQEWIEWAERQADRCDPLVKSPPSILDEKEHWERTY
jgi:hypothetical protein